MKYQVVCDFRENMKNFSKTTNELYSDHPSVKNIKEIIDAIKSLGYQCDYFGGIPELIHAVDCQKTFMNCAFLNFTDGMEQNYSRIQAPALLDILNVPYSGSGVFASALMNNKHFCKQALQNNGILMAKSFIVNTVIPFQPKALSSWKYPVFVKPNCEGSSLGISQTNVCHTLEETTDKIKELQEIFDEIIIEEYISGIDITNYLIGNGEYYYINDVVTAELFDNSPFAIYDDVIKQKQLRTLFYNEEKIPIDILEKIRYQSIKIANIIGVQDICRIDYRLDINTNKLTFIEINSAPRFSSTSEVGFIAQKRNITFEEMVHYYLKTFNNRIGGI